MGASSRMDSQIWVVLRVRVSSRGRTEATEIFIFYNRQNPLLVVHQY